MWKTVIAMVCVAALIGCGSPGISGDEGRAQSEEWNADAYEKAMKEAGRGDEWEAEQEKWAESGQSEESQELDQGGRQPD